MPTPREHARLHLVKLLAPDVGLLRDDLLGTKVAGSGVGVGRSDRCVCFERTCGGGGNNWTGT